MKKGIKIVLCISAGVLLLAGVGIGLGKAITNDLNGTTFIDTPTENPGTYGWRKHEVNIPLNGTSSERYLTNHNDDCIYDIEYKMESHFIGDDTLDITYSQKFDSDDDLETFFVLSNGTDTYITDVETSHMDWWGRDRVFMTKREYEKYNLTTYYISEVWVRTYK